MARKRGPRTCLVCHHPWAAHLTAEGQRRPCVLRPEGQTPCGCEEDFSTEAEAIRARLSKRGRKRRP